VLIAQDNGGSLIAMGSSAGIGPVGGLIPYVASKGGVHNMLRRLAVELALHKIKVNTSLPDMAETSLATSRKGHMEAGLKSVPMNEIV
jgi:NAD(P)-dependent dehydrogenase (short-subunit alcohol dehydrogenase family)